jgi:hypothetical protein
VLSLSSRPVFGWCSVRIWAGAPALLTEDWFFLVQPSKFRESVIEYKTGKTTEIAIILHTLALKIFLFLTGAAICMGFGLLHGSLHKLWRSRNSRFLRSGVDSPTANPQHREPEITIRLAPTLWPYTLRVTGARSLPLHDKAAVLEEDGAANYCS